MTMKNKVKEVVKWKAFNVKYSSIRVCSDESEITMRMKEKFNFNS
jgi:hypothetical protein